MSWLGQEGTRCPDHGDEKPDARTVGTVQSGLAPLETALPRVFSRETDVDDPMADYMQTSCLR